MTDASNNSYLERLAALSDDLFCTVSFEGTFADANEAWTRRLGYTPEDLTRIPFRVLVHPEDQTRVVAALASLAGGTRADRLAFRVRLKDGAFRWFRWNAVPDMEAGVFHAVATDISDLQTANAQIYELNDLLRHSAVMLHASISHAETQVNGFHELIRQIRTILEVQADGSAAIPEQPAA